MRAFSQLLDELVYTRSRNTKLKLIGDYLRQTPDPDRGYGLAALTGTLDLPAVKGAAVRAIAEERVDPVLLYMSRDYVGDMAETVALLWPKPDGEPPEVDDATIRISEAVARLRAASRLDAPHVLARMLDHLDASGRFALLKLATGGLRVGVSARLAKQAAAKRGSTAAPATIFPTASRMWRRRSGHPRCSTASCSCAERRKGRGWKSRRQRASTHSSSGSAARTSAKRCLAPIPLSSASTTS